MPGKLGLYLTNVLLLSGQIVFTVTVIRQVQYSPEQNSSVGLLFLAGWLVLCLTTLAGIFLCHITSKKVSMQLYITAGIFLALEACFAGVRYLQSSNSRVLLIGGLLVQLFYLSYTYTKLILSKQKPG